MEKYTFFCFNVGKEEFAIELSYVKEVVHQPITNFKSGTNPEILNIPSLSRLPIIVWSVKDLFQVKPVNNIKKQAPSIVAINQYEQIYGLIVDSPNIILDIHSNELVCVLSLPRFKNADFIKGFFKRANNVVFVLDIQKLINNKDVFKLQEKISLNVA